MHEKIYDFTLEGEVSDENLVQSKKELVKAVEDGMRDGGYIPVLDIDNQFTLEFVPEKQNYNFTLTIYGVRSDEPWSQAWNNVRKDRDIFAPEQVESVLTALGVNIVSETSTNFLVHCPFHHNHSTPAMSISKETFQYLCFNTECMAKGNAVKMVEEIRECNYYEAKRFISQYKAEINVEEIIRRRAEMDKIEFVEYDQWRLDKHRADFRASPAYSYMKSRGFEDETLKFFDAGYHVKYTKDKSPVELATVPMHDPFGMPVGYFGRAIKEREFHNSPGLPRRDTLWNLHRAKQEGDSLIVTESCFDSMSVHQAGYPNTAAILGGYFSKQHAELIGKSFNTIIVMTDADEVGRRLGQEMMDRMPHKRFLWAAGPEEIYPDGAKDANSLSSDQIRRSLRNAASTMTYNSWYN